MNAIFGVSWTKIGTVISFLVALLSMPELGSIVPPDWMPTIVIGINILMGLKKFFLPAENFR